MENKPQLGLHNIPVPAGSRHKKSYWGVAQAQAMAKHQAVEAKARRRVQEGIFTLGLKAARAP